MTVKSRIKQYLAKNPRLWLVVSIMRRRNDKEFIDYITSASTNSELVYMKELENSTYKLDDKKPFCRIIVGNKNEGLFAMYRWMLDGIFFCDKHGIVPIVGFSDNSLYKDNKMPTDMNVFDYFMNCKTNNVDVGSGRAEILYSSRNGLFTERLNENGTSYAYSKEYVEALAYAQREYISLNEKTQSKISEYIAKLNINSKTIGVHIRGTDYKQNCKGHPIFVEPKDYYPFIDDAMSTGNFDKIFIATDDEMLLAEFINHYGSNCIVFDNDILRSNCNLGVHVLGYMDEKRDNYRLGLEAICDMVALSSCGGIVTGMSQVGLAARVNKRSKNESFIVDHIISKGINEKGKQFKI